MKTILITGVAGFIGYHLAQSLLAESNYRVFGLDNLNADYDINLKQHRLNQLKNNHQFAFFSLDITNLEDLQYLFAKIKPQLVVHLAAKTGVRTSTHQQDKYFQTNIFGFTNILSVSAQYHVEHLIFASSSSVYGESSQLPNQENDNTDHPISVYAATKKCDEILAATFSHLHHLPITALRLFTVYGPFGRPDMAYFTFTRQLVNNEKISVYNHGHLKRDFTYVDDVVTGIKKVIARPLKNGFHLYNLGGGQPYELLDFINILQNQLLKNHLLPQNFALASHLDYQDMQTGDVHETHADISQFYHDFNFKTRTSLDQGLANFVTWYQEYYCLNKGSDA
ncbi:GDP-mannose 4,6-dehydratase [bacterium]|nr:GDP-mannose 4,6-dehydratase [bacterium]